MPCYDCFEEYAQAAHQQALALLTLFRNELGPTHPSTLRMETIVATLAEIIQDIHHLEPSLNPDRYDLTQLSTWRRPWREQP